MSLLGLIRGKRGQSGFGFSSTAEEVTAGLDLTGKTVLVTGVNAGIGNETMRVLAKRGAHVLGTARTIEKARAACDQVDGATTPLACELTDLPSVEKCADQIRKLGTPIDILICNAGVVSGWKLKQTHGIEHTFFTNHIGHFLLVTRLLEHLSDTGRVVMVSSMSHKITPIPGIEFDNLSGEKSYIRWLAYGQSKLANVLFAMDLSRRFKGTQKTANAVHPGVIRTQIARNLGLFSRAVFALTGVLYTKTVGQGAATTCFVAARPELSRVSGRYFADCNERTMARHARNPEMADRLRTASEQITQRVLSSGATA